ncbi:CynX/NimT family MFS transporter [Microbacterium kribbense]|uniref:CynX/NimT family MFS transporter n=1 Tax=Microbacterium kribbense TaxID=433645 RepID=A0ABP7G6S2_9MICO
MLLVAANMRPTITSLGPLLAQIGTGTGMSAAALGLLAAVPLVAWALISPLAHTLSRRFGMARTVFWSLVLLLAGTIVRSLPGPVLSLWLGTALIGAALAIVNVLMPAMIKREFLRVPLMMALYTALLSGVGAVASGVAVPVSQVGPGPGGAGWRFALLIIGAALLPFAAIAWGIATRRTDGIHARPTVDSTAHRARTGIWRDRIAWQVAGYMGLQSASFYMLVTWLAAYSTSFGRSEALAGVDVMVYQIFSLAGSLGVPFALRGRGVRIAPAAIPVLGIIGTAGLMLAPGGVDLWVAIVGVFSGSSLGMALTLLAQRSRDHDTAAALSGMSQSVGYLIAAVGPVVFGAVHAVTGGWIVPLILLAAVMAGQGVVGIFAARDRFVLEAS